MLPTALLAAWLVVPCAHSLGIAPRLSAHSRCSAKRAVVNAGVDMEFSSLRRSAHLERPEGAGEDAGAAAAVAVELFLDLCCPYSKKMFKTLEARSFLQDVEGFSLTVQHVPQPWHAQSSYMHEAALAANLVAPDRYLAYVSALFDRQVEFFDAHVWDLSRAQINAALVEIGGSVGVDAEKLAAALARTHVEGSLNTGNAATPQMKKFVRYHREKGVHVTPTALINGVEAADVSSSWTADQWAAKLAEAKAAPAASS